MGDVTPITNTAEPLVKAEVVAEFLSIEPSTVLSMARKGKIPAYKIGLSKQWRFRMSEIEAWLKQQKESKSA